MPPRARLRAAAVGRPKLALLLLGAGAVCQAHVAPSRADFQDEVRHAAGSPPLGGGGAGGFQRSAQPPSQPRHAGWDELDARRQLHAASAPRVPLYMALAGGARGEARAAVVAAALDDGFHAAAGRLLATAAGATTPASYSPASLPPSSDPAAAAALLSAMGSGGTVTHAPLRDWFMAAWGAEEGAERDPEEAGALEALLGEFKRRNGFAGLHDAALVTRDFSRSWGVRAFFEDAAPALAAARAARVQRTRQQQH